MAGAQSAWGIDVGVSSLKAIKLRRDGDRVTVEAFEVIEHDKFLTEPEVDRDALIRSTLQKFMAKYAVRREIVFIGVPGSSTFARFVKLPPVETKKIPEIVRFEAIQQIPFPLDQVNWDYHTFQQPDSPDVEVGIFAMKKELVAQVMSNFTAVDMPVQGVQMSPVAVYNAVAFDGMTQNKGTVVIDMGAEHTDLVILDQGRLWLRTINIGGNHFTDALAKSFKQPFAKAESLKKTAATSKYQKQIYQSMRPIFADLVAEIQRSIGFYNSAHRDSRLERIIGMGNPFKLPNLQKYLQQELKMDVARLETFAQANVEKAAAFSENILSMTAAYGLAVQALGLAPINSNLLPTEIARKMMWRKKEPWFIGAAALVAIGAIGIGAQVWMAHSALGSQQNLQEANDTAVNNALILVKSWKGVDDTTGNSQTQIDSAMKLAESRKIWPSLTLDIYGALPQAPANREQGLISVTSTSAEYYGKLSGYTTNSGQPGGIGTVAPSPDQQQDPNATPTDAPIAPVQKASGTVGDSDHGFIVTISGYSNSSDFHIASAYQDTLMKRAPLDNKDKPYYFSSPWYTGKRIGGARLGGFGASAASGGAAAVKAPWGGSAPGPFWEHFVTEITGIKPAAPAGAGGPGGFGTPTDVGPGIVGALADPPDLMAPRGPTGVPTILNKYQFTLLFKVHVKN